MKTGTIVILFMLATFACGTSEPDVSAPLAQEETAPQATPVAMDEEVQTADGSLIQLIDPLDEPEFYCVDVPGFGASLDLQSPLTAHTCKPGADDETFVMDHPNPGNLYMPAYDLCVEAEGLTPPVRLLLRQCSDAPTQRFTFDSGGTLALPGGASAARLCMSVSPDDGEPTGGPSHLRRNLMMQSCDAAPPALSRWSFPGPSPG
ncbi:MAG: RICIN domain-containing protein [Chloroflexi bacterium]|nr:RICIN domain-containing protein [Chloroflexota bacterium]MCY3936799.1 RICIN domain-containing protein [Chloroflexota bacterium]